MKADAEELELGLLVKECLETSVRMNLYPKSCIDVFVTVLEDGGGTLAAAITATGTYLLNMLTLTLTLTLTLRLTLTLTLTLDLDFDIDFDLSP